MKYLAAVFILLSVLFAKQVHGQQIVLASVADRVRLEADEYRGNVQWEQSDDENEWVDIAGGDVSPFEIEITSMPVFFRARIEEEGCTQPHYSEVIQVLDGANVQLWSDPETWGTAGIPQDGDEVTIESGDHIILDEATHSLAGLTINGILEFDRADLVLTAESIYIDNGGVLQVGTSESPFKQKAIITLNGTNTSSDANTRGITVINGRLELHGATPDVLWTKVNANVGVGDTEIEVSESVDWQVGDEIVLAPTDYYRAGLNLEAVTQIFTLSNVDGNNLTISTASQAFHWGVMQYVSESGIVENQSEMASPHVSGVPMQLDERAEIGVLTRNIVVQAPDDELWSSQGFGVHTMIMPMGIGHAEGVEFKRAGQAGRIQRYAWHWHMKNITLPNYLEVNSGDYIKNSSVNESRNRGIVIHGTWHTEVSNNVVYNIRGHGVFTEDASERKNVIDHNLVLHVRDPQFGLTLQEHENSGSQDKGSSGFWISNPDNKILNNVAADCGSFGFWLAYPEQCWGLSTGVLNSTDGHLDQPNRTLFDTFFNNSAHSNRLNGIRLDDPPIDQLGNTTGKFYASTTNGREGDWPYDNHRRFDLVGGVVHHNGSNGIWDRSRRVNTTEVVSADNIGRYFAGSGALGLIERCLIVGESLNENTNGTLAPTSGDFASGYSGGETAVASYHFSFSFDGNLMVNFPAISGKRSGAFDASDLYIRAVEEGTRLITNNRLINSHAGVKLWALDDHYTLASVTADPQGLWGPQGSYYAFDVPFLTAGEGLEVFPVEPAEASGGVSIVGGKWAGIRGFVINELNEFYRDLWAVDVVKYEQDDEMNLQELGSWGVASSTAGELLDHMKDAALNDLFIYELTFPENDNPTTFDMLVDNLISEDQLQVIGIEFDGSIDPAVYITSPGSAHTYQPVGSLQELIDHSTGEVWFQDKGNNRVWVKLRGGRWQYWTSDPNESEPSFEETTYQTIELHISEQ